MDSNADGEIFNIGNSNEPLSLSQLAQLAISICGEEGVIEPKYQTDFSNTDRTLKREIFERYCDTSKAREKLNYIPRVSIENGIKKVIEHGVLFPKWKSTDLIYTLQNE